NFGQTTLQDKHIKGTLTATLDFSGSWSNQLVADQKSLRASSTLIIDRGELIGFQPLLSLSRFVEVEELQHIKFSSLQSSVQIENKVISIPRTTIRNSVLNLDVWGTHDFDSRID